MNHCKSFAGCKSFGFVLRSLRIDHIGDGSSGLSVTDWVLKNRCLVSIGIKVGLVLLGTKD